MKTPNRMVNYVPWLFILLLCFESKGQLLASLPATAQSKSTRTGNSGIKQLSTVLKELEMKYDISFTYDRTTVENKRVEVNHTRFKSAQQELDFILQSLDLRYEKLNDKIFLILPAENNRGTKTESVSLTSNQFGMNYESQMSKRLNFMLENQIVQNPADIVRGRVVSSVDGAAIPGVNIILKNSSTGTVTDGNGNFNIEIRGQNPVLVFSYIGFNTQEVSVSNLSHLEITLEESIETLQEAVVTALGIKREKRSLGYSVGNVSGEALTETPQPNVLTALTGKVPGVQISQMSGAAGSSVNVVIRGSNSLNNDNQPLFVIDGVPVANRLNNAFGGADMGNPISDINPDDIASVSVLKGPSAAALYGSRAGNGVILITTKSGTGGKKGIGVSLNSSTVMDFPFRYVGVQNKFASGKSGAHVLEESENESWGPRLDVGEQWLQWNSNGEKAPLVSYPDRFKDFFQKGWTFTNNVAVNGNYDKGNFRLSFGNMENSGVIPNTDLSRITVALNSTYNITDRFRATANFNVTQSGSDNRPIIDGGRTDPVRSLYEMGAQVNILDLQQYWQPGSEGLIQRKYKEKQNNPYFVLYENATGFKRDRTVSKLQLDYDLTDDLSLMGRYTRDSYTEIDEAKVGYSNYDQQKGGYSIANKYQKESNLDFMIAYRKTLNDDWSLNAMAGANRLEQNFQSTSNVAGELTLPGLFTISNGEPGTVTYNSYLSKKVMYGVYGSASVGFQDKVYLDLTARNDWSSTLPKANRSYFYPSASVSVILSEIFRMPDWITLGKIRAGSAQVGNDVGPYSLNQVYSTATDWGTAKRMYMGGQMRNAMLKPEISTSNEIGVDFRFFNNRIGLEATYYTRQNKNQVLSINIPIESGASSKLINAGLVQSNGWELGLNTTPVSKGDFTWDLNFSFTRNRTYIKELAEGIEYFNFTSYQGAEVRTYKGGQVGDIYMRPVLTVKDQASPYYGYPILTSSGIYQTDNDVQNMVKIGNFNNNFNLGIQPTFRYKSVSLYANIDWRQGGSFYSNTMMFLGNNGMLEETISGVPYDASRDMAEQIKANPDAYLGNWVGGRNAEFGGFAWPGAESDYRLNDASFNVGVRENKAADGSVEYIENLGGSTTKWLVPFDAYRYANRPFPDRNLYSATYVKLREIAVTYHLPKSFVNRFKVQNASLSVVGNNLYAWTKANNGVDPERAFRQSGNTWQQGVEYYNVMPWTASLGFKLKVDF